MKITKESKIVDIIRDNRETLKVFDKYGLICPTCKGATEDTVRHVAVNNGLDVESFLTELQKAGSSR
jgi:hybrid cluster-associated redox disulfide protein